LFPPSETRNWSFWSISATQNADFEKTENSGCRVQKLIKNSTNYFVDKKLCKFVILNPKCANKFNLKKLNERRKLRCVNFHSYRCYRKLKKIIVKKPNCLIAQFVIPALGKVEM